MNRPLTSDAQCFLAGFRELVERLVTTAAAMDEWHAAAFFLSQAAQVRQRIGVITPELAEFGKAFETALVSGAVAARQQRRATPPLAHVPLQRPAQQSGRRAARG